MRSCSGAKECKMQGAECIYILHGKIARCGTVHVRATRQNARHAGTAGSVGGQNLSRFFAKEKTAHPNRCTVFVKQALRYAPNADIW